MKKILSTILGLITIAGFILAGAEHPDGSADIAWSTACICISIICGFLYAKLNPNSTMEV